MIRLLMDINLYLVDRQVSLKTIQGTVSCKIQNLIIELNYLLIELIKYTRTVNVWC
jgi:hypothetical protein